MQPFRLVPGKHPRVRVFRFTSKRDEKKNRAIAKARAKLLHGIDFKTATEDLTDEQREELAKEHQDEVLNQREGYKANGVRKAPSINKLCPETDSGRHRRDTDESGAVFCKLCGAM